MINNRGDIAKAYYEAMSHKDMNFIEQHVHPNVHFIGPMAEFTGKDKYLDSVKKLFTLFKGLRIRTQFSVNDQAVIVYNVDFPDPIGISRAVALLDFKDNLISRIELFYDARPFEEMAKKIFSNP